MSVVENSLYCRLSIEQSPSRCCGLSIDDVQQWIVGITISRGSFVFSQSCVKVSTSLANIGSLAVGAFDLVDCSLSVVRFVSVSALQTTYP